MTILTDIRWVKITERLPPKESPKAFWSQTVWLALSNGKVERGCFHYRAKKATYSAPVHAWFIDNFMLEDGLEVIAWLHYGRPDFPTDLLGSSPSHSIAGTRSSVGRLRK